MSSRVLRVRETVGVRTSLRVDDTTHDLSVDSRLTLLDGLRDVLGLTSTLPDFMSMLLLLLKGRCSPRDVTG